MSNIVATKKEKTVKVYIEDQRTGKALVIEMPVETVIAGGKATRPAIMEDLVTLLKNDNIQIDTNTCSIHVNNCVQLFSPEGNVLRTKSGDLKTKDFPSTISDLQSTFIDPNSLEVTVLIEKKQQKLGGDDEEVHEVFQKSKVGIFEYQLEKIEQMSQQLSNIEKLLVRFIASANNDLLSQDVPQDLVDAQEKEELRLRKEREEEEERQRIAYEAEAKRRAEQEAEEVRQAEEKAKREAEEAKAKAKAEEEAKKLEEQRRKKEEAELVKKKVQEKFSKKKTVSDDDDDDFIEEINTSKDDDSLDDDDWSDDDDFEEDED